MNSNQIMIQGLTKVNNGDFTGGIPLVNQAIALDPNDPEKLHARGQIYSALKKTHEAVLDYKKAIELNPNVFQYHYNLGNVYFDNRQFEDALVCYTKAIQLNPNDSDIYSNRGMCFIQVSKRKDAYNDFKKALSINPNDQPAKTGINILLSVDPTIKTQDSIDEKNYNLELEFTFHSPHHLRFEKGIQKTVEPDKAMRAIKVKPNINGDEGYTVSIYNLDVTPPSLQMAPKQMKVILINENKIVLRGFGNDTMGNSFDDYGLTLKLENGCLDYCILHLHDRDINIEYYPNRN